jgi:hypothetical protein
MNNQYKSSFMIGTSAMFAGYILRTYKHKNKNINMIIESTGEQIFIIGVCLNILGGLNYLIH